MSRDGHPRHIPFCQSRVALVDQYLWKNNDSTERLCHNGVSHGIYACNGEISRTLPLDLYPRIDEIHPQVRDVPVGSHFEARDPRMRAYIAAAEHSRRDERVEGLYLDGAGYDAHGELMERRRRATGQPF